MPKLIKRELVLVEIESTYGTDPTPVGTDAVLVENVSWSHAGARMAERNPIKSTLGKEQSIYAGTLMEMSFDIEIKGSGTAGTAPEIGKLLRACGMGETIVASTSVTYAPISTAMESITVYFYEDGSRYILTGGRGTVSFAMATGEVGKASVTITGHIASPTDVALATPSYNSTVPSAMISVPFSAGGYSAVINSLSLDIGNEIATPGDISAADGYSEIIITDRDPSGSFDPEQTLIATADFIGDWKAGTSLNITTGAIGATGGNIYTLTAPTSFYREVSPSDRDGLRTMDITFGCAGDDAAFSLAFT